MTTTLTRIEAITEVAQAVARIGTPEAWALRVVVAVSRATRWWRMFIFRRVEDELRHVEGSARGGAPLDLERAARWLRSIDAQSIR